MLLQSYMKHINNRRYINHQNSDIPPNLQQLLILKTGEIYSLFLQDLMFLHFLTRYC